MKDHEFDALMKEFRSAAVQTADEQYALTERKQPAVKTGWFAPRWAVPALAGLLLAGAGTARLVHHGGTQKPVTANTQTPTQNTPQISDDALLSSVESDLSDRVPQALAPLAVSYTTHATSTKQKEYQR